MAWFPYAEVQRGETDCERHIPIELLAQMHCAAACEDPAVRTSSLFVQDSCDKGHHIWVAAKDRDTVLRRHVATILPDGYSPVAEGRNFE